jgi:hypothetical protein
MDCEAVVFVTETLALVSCTGVGVFSFVATYSQLVYKSFGNMIMNSYLRIFFIYLLIQF